MAAKGGGAKKTAFRNRKVFTAGNRPVMFPADYNPPGFAVFGREEVRTLFRIRLNRFSGFSFDAYLQICQSVHVVNVRVKGGCIRREGVFLLHVVEVVRALQFAPNVGEILVMGCLDRFSRR